MSEYNLSEPYQRISFDPSFLCEHCTPEQVEEMYRLGVVSFGDVEQYYQTKEREEYERSQATADDDEQEDNAGDHYKNTLHVS